MIKGSVILTILITAVGCGSGTGSTPAGAPVQSPSPAACHTTLCVAATADLTVSGDVTGKMTLTSDSGCYGNPPPDQALVELDFRGAGLQTVVPNDAAQSGKAWALVVDGSATNPDSVDAGLGPLLYHRSVYLSHAGDSTQSRVTIGKDLRSGSLNLQLKADPADVARPGARVRVVGTFTCAFT